MYSRVVDINLVYRYKIRRGVLPAPLADGVAAIASDPALTLHHVCIMQAAVKIPLSS